MSESEKLLSKKGTKRIHNKKQNKLLENEDNYGTLTKQYIVQDAYPRTHFSALHCLVVSFVFIFSLAFITISLLIGLPRVRQRYEEYHSLNVFNASTQSTYTTAFESLI